MEDQIKPVVSKQYYCYLCREWEDPEYCESHFESGHGQKKVTIEGLESRWRRIGCWDTREAPVEETSEKKPKSWMFKDDFDPDAPIITNNFKHNV